ncbi:MAG: hypothetical protein A2X49_06690 [Lentisphaerae bacterium GWF2_52_8]|nr:MAG: hypothetical protein A2X49_06690 [Lentisphaerae bacterium GWF2_52_8]
MKKAEILISHNVGYYNIRVEGRATFECSPPLRNLAKSIEHEKFKKISVNLRECCAMDSTFMGVLAMLGLASRKVGAVMEIANASPSNMALLSGLGLKKLFSFVTRDTMSETGEWRALMGTGEGLDKEDNARTVLEAHDTLMDIDASNIPKFERVVDMVKKDIDKMGGDKKPEDLKPS